MREIVLALLFWISGQTGYEVNIDPPRLVFLSPSQVVETCIDEGTLIPYAAEACYKLHKHAIYLRDDFSIFQPERAGTLVHELTHVLQLSNGLDYNLQTMDALEYEADRMERTYEASRGIQIKVRNLAQGGSTTNGTRVTRNSRDFGYDEFPELRSRSSRIREATIAARSDSDRYDGYRPYKYYPGKSVIESKLDRNIYDTFEPAPFIQPTAKKRTSTPSPLKREILARLGKYQSPRPAGIEGRIVKKLSRRPYPGEISAAKPDLNPSARRFYVLVLPGDTVSRLAGIYGVSPQAIRSMNGIRGEFLTPGERILIP